MRTMGSKHNPFSWMALILIGVLILSWALILAFYKPIRPPSPPPARLERLLEEGTDQHKREIWHDKETGQEIICFNNYNMYVSCLLSGRKL